MVKTIIVAVVLATGVAAAVAAKAPEANQASALPAPVAPPSSPPATYADQINDGIKWPSYIPPAKWPVLFSGAVDSGVDICLEVSPAAARLWPQGSWELKGRIRANPATDLRLGVEGVEVPISKVDGFAVFSSRLEAGKHTLRLMLGSPASALSAQLVLTTSDFGDRPDLLKSCGVLPVSAPRDSRATSDAQSKGTAVAEPYGDATGGNGRPGSTLAPRETGPLVFSGKSLRSKTICFETIGPKGVSLYGKEADLGDYYLGYRVALQPAEQYNLRMDGDNFAIAPEPRGYVVGAHRITSGRHLFTVTVRNPVDKLLIELLVQDSDKLQRVGLKECPIATTEQLKSEAARQTVSKMPPGPAAGDAGGDTRDAFRIGGGVSAPVPIYKPEPEYSEDARAAKFQGTVMLAVVIGVDGKASSIIVVRSLGMGLDEKAIDAVQKWRFKPGFKDGKPVPVKANLEVNFRLL